MLHLASARRQDCLSVLLLSALSTLLLLLSTFELEVDSAEFLLSLIESKSSNCALWDLNPSLVLQERSESLDPNDSDHRENIESALLHRVSHNSEVGSKNTGSASSGSSNQAQCLHRLPVASSTKSGQYIQAPPRWLYLRSLLI